jgi:hypothetical protein
MTAGGFVAAVTLGLGGCAAGLTSTGTTVVGFEVGEEATTLQRAGEFAQSVAPFLPAPWGSLLALGGAAVGGGEILRRKTKAQIAAERERARLQGREEGWDSKVRDDAMAKAGIPPPTGAA